MMCFKYFLIKKDYLFVFEVLGRNLLRHFQKSPNVRLDHSEVKSITKDVFFFYQKLYSQKAIFELV